MAQKISRRGVVGALGIVMGGLVNAPGASASPPLELSLRGTVSWCNRARGLVKFRPDRRDASEQLIEIEMDDNEMPERLKVLAPSRVATISLRWRPNVDILAPWQAVEIIGPGGERFAALQGNNSS
jgi:hypothetical protein